MKKLIIFLLLLSAAPVWAQQTGFVLRGYQVFMEGSAPGSSTAPVGTRLRGILPFESVNFFQRNAPAQPLDRLFTNALGTDTRPKTDGQLFRDFSSIYTYPEGLNPTIDSLAFWLPYGGDGFSVSQMYLYSTDRTTGVESLIWQTNSSYFKAQNVKIKLPVAANPKSIRIFVVNNANPVYLKFYGSYNNIPTYVYPIPVQYPLRNQFGANIFHYNILAENKKNVDSTRLKRATELTGGLRHYWDHQILEPTEGNFYFNPTPWGGWYMDSMYYRCWKSGNPAYPCIKTIPDWLWVNYPDSVFAFKKDGVTRDRINEIPVVVYPADLEVPASYLPKAKAGFQVVARYGHNKNIPLSLLKVNTTVQGAYPGAPADQKKVGLGWINTIEDDNERDKDWRGRIAHQTGREFAAEMSAFFDGHKNTMGPGAGVRNADSTINVYMGGMAQTKADWLADMRTWIIENRGYRPDGSLDIPFTHVVYHVYLGNLGGQDVKSTFGINIEDSFWLQDYPKFRNFVARYFNNIPIVCNESGYDWQAKGSNYGIPAIVGKDTMETHADWTYRMCVVMGRYGQHSMQMFLYKDQGTSGVFGTSGMVNNDYSRREIGDYFVQTNKLMPNAVFQAALEESATTYAYQYTDLPSSVPKYIVWSPTHVNRKASYTLSVPGATSVSVYKLTRHADDALKTTVTGPGSFVIPISETPVIVIPN